MPIPELEPAGHLPAGIHAAPLAEVSARCGAGSALRQRQSDLPRQVVEAAKAYPTIKRVLVRGSFVTDKVEPNDLDYSVIVSLWHHRTEIASPHRRFFVPATARQFYGIDKSYLVIKDYPLDVYVERLGFICEGRDHRPRGILEISIRGETTGEEP